jgi:YfiH family protein
LDEPTLRPELPAGVSTVCEIRAPDLPVLVHPGWSEAFPWVVAGATTRGSSPAPFDLRLFGSTRPEDEVRANWERLRRMTGSREIVHARQVHGARVHLHGSPAAGMADPYAPLLVEDADGHATAASGLLLAVSTADCVPVLIVDDAHRAVAAVHAGWRGAAAGILEAGLDAMSARFGTRPTDAYVHFGPAICGRCYEVGPEVFTALGEPEPPAPTPIDLRAVLAGRALALGVAPGRVSVSAHCTRCTGSALFSHRGGDAGRQVGFIGIRDTTDGGGRG